MVFRWKCYMTLLQVCEKYKLPYFAVYGTAIGAVRHAGFIPWDDDIDVGMLRVDYDKFMEIFSKEMSDKYNLLTPQIDGQYSCTVTHIQRKNTKFVSEVTQNLKCEQCFSWTSSLLTMCHGTEKNRLHRVEKQIYLESCYSYPAIRILLLTTTE